MDDTQVDWTKRIETPKPAPEDPSGMTPEDRLERLERGARRSRIVIAVLALVIALLVVVVAVLAVNLASRGAAQGADAAGQSITADTDVPEAAGSAQAEDDGAGASSAEVGEGTSSAGEGDGQASTDDAAGSDDGQPLRATDLSFIVGEKWSNALRMLEAAGIDSNSLVLITDDGGRVFDPGNWTVTVVADMDDTGQVAVYLRHDIDWF